LRHGAARGHDAVVHGRLSLAGLALPGHAAPAPAHEKPAPSRGGRDGRRSLNPSGLFHEVRLTILMNGPASLLLNPGEDLPLILVIMLRRKLARPATAAENRAFQGGCMGR